MRRALFLATLAFLPALFAGSPAYAEEQMPGFSMPGAITPDDVAAMSVDFDEAFDTIENQYLADTLKLNYQISLLEKMVARQAELEKISESYAAMGVVFTPPPPPRGICAQLPPNAPCLKYHPDLYPALVDSRKAYYEELERKARMVAEPERKEGETDKQMEARKKREAAEKKRIADIKERDNRYRWTDVTCFDGSCRGTLVTSSMDGFRATVHEGDHLPDGTKIQAISTRGIRVSIDGQVVDVRPAPGENATDTSNAAAGMANTLADAGVGSANGGKSSDPAATTAAAQAAAANLIANASNKPGSTQGAASPFSGGMAPVGNGQPTTPAASGGGAGGQTTVEPALGPSGLF